MGWRGRAGRGVPPCPHPTLAARLRGEARSDSRGGATGATRSGVAVLRPRAYRSQLTLLFIPSPAHTTTLRCRCRSAGRRHPLRARPRLAFGSPSAALGSSRGRGSLYRSSRGCGGSGRPACVAATYRHRSRSRSRPRLQCTAVQPCTAVHWAAPLATPLHAAAHRCAVAAPRPPGLTASRPTCGLGFQVSDSAGLKPSRPAVWPWAALVLGSVLSLMPHSEGNHSHIYSEEAILKYNDYGVCSNKLSKVIIRITSNSCHYI